MKQKRLDRINELARKQKTVGLTDAEKAEQKKLREEYLADFRLTDAEKAEQKKLREEYLADFRKTLRGQLENISFVEADGSITPLSSLRKKDI